MILLDRLSNFVWCNFFFGNKPKGAKKDYLNIAEQVKKKNYPEVENYEKKKNIAIDKHFLDYLALHTQITIKKSECCYAHGRLLYAALSDYLLKKPKELSKEKIIIIETGTASGFSAICMAKALEAIFGNTTARSIP
jgi:predicted O-methyltransferase YrrM